MSERRESPLFLLTLLYSLWLLSFVYSFVRFFTIEPVVIDSEASMERIMAFLGWQGIALVLAVAVWAMGRRWSRRSSVRRLTLLPIGLAFLLSGALFGAVLWVGPA
jgi:hypothetical protein